MDLLGNILSFLMLVLLAAADETSTYATCGDTNSADVDDVVNVTVDKLMELRQPTWGWVNTPEVVLGLQLSAQKQFFARDRAIEQMRIEIDEEIDSMNIGKLALYVLALKSACQNPTNFSGRDLVKLLNKRSRKQFLYNGERHTVPFDRYYRYGLTMGALCVSNNPLKNWALRRVLNGQNDDGSFGEVHSVDDAAQILLGLKCVQTETRYRKLMEKVNSAVEKVASFLRSQTATSGSDVWIGNKYSSPSSALALMLEERDSSVPWQCRAVMNSLAVDPEPLDKEGGLSQRLPALAGISYLDLKLTSWECETPVPVPDGYQPVCDPTDPPTCNGDAGMRSLATEIMIDVRLTVFTDPPPSLGDVPNADVTVNVRNGSTLYEAMDTARTDGEMTFQSRTTAWGQSIISIQGVAANSTAREYWSLIDGATGQPLPRGASSYVPVDDEQIVFRLKTW